MGAIDAFLGLDVRQGERPNGALEVATNILIDGRGSIIRRPGLVRQATLPEGTAGLYAVDDTLRAVAPNGTDPAGIHPAIYLDFIDTAAALSGHVRAVRLPSGRRALYIESEDGIPTLHATAANVEQTVAGSRLSIAWTPRGLLTLGGRLFTLDRSRSYLSNSGVADPTMNDGEGYIRNWEPTISESDDAQNGGFANAAQSSSSPQAIGEYGGQVAVLGIGAVQLWEVGAGGIVGLSGTIGGPGTRHPYALATMSGDLLYIDGAGRIRSLADDVANGGKPSEATIGDEVADITEQLTGYADKPRAIYARTMGAYLMASGNTVVAMSYQPGKGKLGWSTWDMPVAIDELEECRGVVYARSGRALYSLRNNVPDDEVDTGDRRPIPIALETVPEVGAAATWRQVAAVLNGSASLRIRTDGVLGSASVLTGRAPAPAMRIGGWRGRSRSVRLDVAAAPADWRMDALVWR